MRSIAAGTPRLPELDRDPRRHNLFCHLNGIHNVIVTPCHPSSNSMEERAEQTFLKQSFKKLKEGTMEQQLSRLLFAYRLTPHSITGRSPAELLLDRQPRPCLDLLKQLQQRRWNISNLGWRVNFT